MAKLLILLAVVVLAVLLLSKARGRTRKPPQDGAKGAAPADEPPKMVACAHCGVHLPQPDALIDAAGRHYCGEPHRLAGPR